MHLLISSLHFFVCSFSVPFHAYMGRGDIIVSTISMVMVLRCHVEGIESVRFYITS